MGPKVHKYVLLWAIWSIRDREATKNLKFSRWCRWAKHFFHSFKGQASVTSDTIRCACLRAWRPCPQILKQPRTPRTPNRVAVQLSLENTAFVNGPICSTSMKLIPVITIPMTHWGSALALSRHPTPTVLSWDLGVKAPRNLSTSQARNSGKGSIHGYLCKLRVRCVGALILDSFCLESTLVIRAADFWKLSHRKCRT